LSFWHCVHFCVSESERPHVLKHERAIMDSFSCFAASRHVFNSIFINVQMNELPTEQTNKQTSNPLVDLLQPDMSLIQFLLKFQMNAKRATNPTNEQAKAKQTNKRTNKQEK
jgi:hypothetical protein